jgi:hypothetical protein
MNVPRVSPWTTTRRTSRVYTADLESAVGEAPLVIEAASEPPEPPTDEDLPVED